MSKAIIPLSSILSIFLLISTPAFATIEEAKAALSEKKYAEAEKALEKELEKKPSDEALRLGAQAAAGMGRYYTAHLRSSQLLKKLKGSDLDFLAFSAKVAGLAGEKNLAMTRYNSFVRKVQDKEKLKPALEFLLSHGLFPSAVQKYIEINGADSYAWNKGYSILRKLISQDDATGGIQMADVLLQHFHKDKPKNDNVTYYIDWALREGIIKSPKEKMDALLAISKYKNVNLDRVKNLISYSWKGMNDSQRMEMLIKVHRGIHQPFPWGILSYFDQTINKLNEAGRIQAGKEFYSFFKAHGDKEIHYLYVIMRHPSVFHIEGNEIVTDDDILNILKIDKKFYDKGVAGHMYSYIDQLDRNYLATNKAKRIAFLKKHLRILNARKFKELISKLKGGDIDTTTNEYLRNCGIKKRIDAEYELTYRYNIKKEKAKVDAAIKNYIGAYPGNFNHSHVMSYYGNSRLFSVNEKVALLKTALAKGGSSTALVNLANQMSRNKSIGSDPAFQAVKKEIDSNKKGSDPVASAQVGAYRSKKIKEVYNIAKNILATYKGNVPSSYADAKDLNELMMFSIFERHRSLAWSNRQNCYNWAKLWAPYIKQTGYAWDMMSRRVREHGGSSRGGALWSIGQHFAKLVNAGQEWSKDTRFNFSRYNFHPANDTKGSIFKPSYSKMGVEAIYYVASQYNSWSPEVYVKEVEALVNAPGVPFDKARSYLASMIQNVYNRSSAKVKPSVEMVHKMMNLYVSIDQKSPGMDRRTEAYLCGILSRSGRPNESLELIKKFMQSMTHRSKADRVNLADNCFGYSITMNQDIYKYLYLDVIKKSLEVMDAQEKAQISFHHHTQSYLNNYYLKNIKDEGEKAEAKLLQEMLGEAIMSGATSWGGHGYYYAPEVKKVIAKRLNAKDWEKVSAGMQNIIPTVISYTRWSTNNSYWVKPVEKMFEEAKAYEIFYTYISALKRDIKSEKKQAEKDLNVVQARYAREIPGLLPVDKDDPTYDLHIATQSLLKGNQERAWELTQPKLPLLQQNWDKLDPNYVVWSVEKMRKQKLYKEALQFCFTILLKEFELDAETVASVSLSKGDIYRGQENYQAARIEYKSLKDNKRYKKTEAGEKAKFRLIELMILTKDYGSAELQLERLVDSGSILEQAEAYYLMAKIAYDQDEYKEAKKILGKVFKRQFEHTRGRLLEGELKTKVAGGLESTEVLIGEEGLKTVAIPGRELTLKLQDENLQVSQGGKAIPVLVTTTKGGDEEKLKLLASSGDGSLFKATIHTGLGKIQKNNLMLELRGDEQVSYIIDPQFQKDRGINYEAKLLDIKANAKIVASAGEILSEEEREKRDMEMRLRRMNKARSKREIVSRTGKTVRPGSPIYVQVTDLDRDMSEENDKIKIKLETQTGDIIEGFELEETEAHSGVFQGKVPTGIPFPLASASDTADGKDPISVINSKRRESWTSIEDGKKPKWLEVDTMTSHAIKEASIELPTVGAIKKLVLTGTLEEDEIIASFPEDQEAAKGGLTVEVLWGSSDHVPTTIMRKFRRGSSQKYWQRGTTYDRKDTQWNRNGWMLTKVSGVFWVKKNKTFEFKLIHKPSPSNWQYGYVYIDGRQILGGYWNDSTMKRVAQISLTEGAHKIEMLVRDHWQKSSFTVGYKNESGDFVAMPSEWFSITENEELANLLQPKGKIQKTATGFTARLMEPLRYRRLRWNFEEFDGNAVTVSAMTVLNDKKETVIPVEEDFTMGKSNRILEISPGDEITVSYEDEHRLKKDDPTIMDILDSSFHNAEVSLRHEEIAMINDREKILLLPAKRCRPGDQLMVVINDYDNDLTDEPDKVPFLVKTSSGEKLRLTAIEDAPEAVNNKEDAAKHSGVFYCLLRFGDKTEKDMIKVVDGDKILIEYLDKENTNPGIPIERTYELMVAGNDDPELTIYRTSTELVEDKSEIAQKKLVKLRRKGIKDKDLKIYRRQIVANHPEYSDENAGISAAADEEGEAIPVSVEAPLLLEVNYPRMAIHSGSKLSVSLVADSELEAAKGEGREPVALELPMKITGVYGASSSKGYPIKLNSPYSRTEEDMLSDGSFTGVVRLQVGSPGDPIDDLITVGEREFATAAERKASEAARDDDRYRVPTLLVSGSDKVTIQYKNEKGENMFEQKVQLLADGRLELLDASYSVQKKSVHLGEKMYLRVTDPDQDVSDDRDKVEVEIKAKSGATKTLALEETLPHSGVFSLAILPKFYQEENAAAAEEAPKAEAAKKADAKAEGAEKKEGEEGAKDEGELSNTFQENTIAVNFGDDVSFTYVDKTPLSQKTPKKIEVKGFIHHGADGAMASFTKRFSDPEMAVKTRFLIAEALFEMAKDHRKLKKKDLANEEIAKGKRILEEAMRDYPNTTLVAQGEFLLANLAQELKKYQEAIGRYSNVIAHWPDSEFAARSQFKKAICLEKMENYNQACEEYVKLTYIYPDSNLVADATVRLGNYYYKQKKYKTAGNIFKNFQVKNPQHKLAPKALFLSGQSYMKMEDFKSAAKTFKILVDTYTDDKRLRPEAMYWLGECYFKATFEGHYIEAYRTFKRLTWDYPTTKWAKIARGRLTEDAFANVEDD